MRNACTARIWHRYRPHDGVGGSGWEAEGFFCFKGRCFNLPRASASGLLQLFPGPTQSDGGLEVAEEVLVFSVGRGIAIPPTMVFEASRDKVFAGTLGVRPRVACILRRMSKTAPILAIPII